MKRKLLYTLVYVIFVFTCNIAPVSALELQKNRIKCEITNIFTASIVNYFCLEISLKYTIKIKSVNIV